MRNPNRYGSISKLGGTRRRPYMVREGVTGRQKIIGYTATKQEAMQLLADYNRNPWNLKDAKMTVKEVIDLFFESSANRYADSTLVSYRTASRHLESLYRIPYADIKVLHMQQTLDRLAGKASMQHMVRHFWSALDKTAVRLDIIQTSYADRLLVSEKPKSAERTLFTRDEISALWSMQGDVIADSVLFMLYTGYRRIEMLQALCESVNTNDCYIKGGVKTKAGRNRIVPIHPKIKPLVLRRLSESYSGYLFEVKGKPINNGGYFRRFEKVLHEIHAVHIPHECRHTFRSELASKGADRICMDRLMGHSSGNVGYDVYTHKNIEDLRKTIELIDY